MAEHSVVVRVVAGSNPVIHPQILAPLRCFFISGVSVVIIYGVVQSSDPKVFWSLMLLEL